MNVIAIVKNTIAGIMCWSMLLVVVVVSGISRPKEVSLVRPVHDRPMHHELVHVLVNLSVI